MIIHCSSTLKLINRKRGLLITVSNHTKYTYTRGVKRKKKTEFLWNTDVGVRKTVNVECSKKKKKKESKRTSADDIGIANRHTITKKRHS